MLYRIVAITFVGLLSLALADQSIAKTKKEKENQGQLEASQAYKKALQNQLRVNPNPGAGPKGGTTASAPRSSGRK